MLIALNLRGPIVSVSPVLGLIEKTLYLSPITAGLLITIPLLIFTCFSSLVSYIVVRVGMEKSLLISICLIFIGLATRGCLQNISFFGGTVLISLGIVISNVVLPSFVKKHFPNHITIMTSLYVLIMGLGAWLSTSTVVPIINILKEVGFNDSYSLQLSLLSFITITFITIIIWLPQVKAKNSSSNLKKTKHEKHIYVWKSKIAWQITFFLGLNSFLMYVFTAWLPSILSAKGYSAEMAGYIAGFFQLSSSVSIVILILLMKIVKNDKIIAFSLSHFTLIGILGLLFNTYVSISVILTGIGIGAGFTLGLMLISSRSQNEYQAVYLSSMAQSIGYLIASIGPIAVGFIHNVTNDWTAVLSICLASSIIVILLSIFAAESREIDILIDL